MGPEAWDGGESGCAGTCAQVCLTWLQHTTTTFHTVCPSLFLLTLYLLLKLKSILRITRKPKGFICVMKERLATIYTLESPKSQQFGKWNRAGSNVILASFCLASHSFLKTLLGVIIPETLLALSKLSSYYRSALCISCLTTILSISLTLLQHLRHYTVTVHKPISLLIWESSFPRSSLCLI